MVIIDPLNEAVARLKKQFRLAKKGDLIKDIPLRLRLDLLDERQAFKASLVDRDGEILSAIESETGWFVVTGTGPANDHENPIFYSPNEKGVLVAEC